MKQTILIAGATGNIGKAAAIALAERDARVVLLGRKLEKLNATKEAISESLSEANVKFESDDIATLVIDFSDMKSVRLAAAEALRRFPVINTLVLSVGALLQKGPNIISGGHEAMFATNVLGPFLFTQLLLGRMEESNGMVLHVIAPFYKKIDWDDLESIRKHKAMTAFDRTKTLNRVMAGELARRYEGRISSVAFDPGYVIDKTDPDLAQRWPSGLYGFLWRMMTIIVSRHPSVAGEPLAELILSERDRTSMNGAQFKLYKQIKKPDRAMNDERSGRQLWEELELKL